MLNTLKTSFILLIMLVTAMGLNAQKKNQIEFHISPTLSYRNLQNDKYIFFDHKMALRYDLGLTYSILITEKIRLGSGVGFSRMGYTVSTYDYIDGKFDLSYLKDFLEIPMLFSYAICKNDTRAFLLDAGLIHQFLLHGEYIVKETKEDWGKMSYKDLKDRDYKMYTIAFMLGCSYQHFFENSLYLKLSPYFKYGIFNMDNVHDYALGLKIGVGYGF